MGTAGAVSEPAELPADNRATSPTTTRPTASTTTGPTTGPGTGSTTGPTTGPAVPTPAPAFYADPRALTRPAVRDWWNVLHPPYTLWHLSYVVIGSCLAPPVDGGRLVATVVAVIMISNSQSGKPVTTGPGKGGASANGKSQENEKPADHGRAHGQRNSV